MKRPILPAAPVERRRWAERASASLRLILVSGAFLALVSALLWAGHLRNHRADPLDSEEMRALKAELASRPLDEPLKLQIRALDLELRRAFFQRQAGAAQSAWLLLGGALAFLLANYAWSEFRPVPPQPQLESDRAERLARDTSRARWSVGVLGGVAIAGLAALWVSFDPPLSWASGAPSTGAAEEPGPVTTEPPTDEEMARNWPRFRGPDGQGHAPAAQVPLTWNVKTGEHVLWKAALPLPGASSPLVWEDRIFLTGAAHATREVCCFRASSGALLWRWKVEGVSGSPREAPEVSEDAGHAASTPATDGRRVYALFANGDLVALDLAGRKAWARNLGPLHNSYGYASSLVLWRDRLIVQLDVDERGRLLALNAATGATLWETPRELGGAWSSPILARTASGVQLITTAQPKVIAYDPYDGRELWSAEGLGGDVAPSPVFGGGLVFAANEGSALLALRTGGQGDVTATHVAWKAEEGLPDTASPLTDGRWVWLVSSSGQLTCYEAQHGEKKYTQDLGDTFYASPSLVGERLLLLSRKGTALWVKAGPAFEELGRAELGEPVSASPAFRNGRIFIRGNEHLFALGAQEKPR